jgi:UDP-N-acetylmuramoyl-tripeptide--D-alanyl-D-alanine ligase
MNMPDLHRRFLESKGVCTDTRKVSEGELFFALKGPNFNGNLFAVQALEAGASFVVVDESSGTPDDRTIMVDDVLATLQELACYHRMQFDIPVIGVTGSNGKTTNKELLYAVLSHNYRTLCTKGNLNNHIGVPLTLLDLKKDHEIAVVEMGANHIGEIRDLCEIARPGYALITSIGEAHLEGFGSMEGIKRGKKELFDHVVNAGGRCFINLAQPIVPDLYHGPEDQAILFGDAAHPPFIVSREQRPCLSAEFQLNGETMRVDSQLIGSFQDNNLLHALAIADFFGVDSGRIKTGLEGYVPTNNRAELTSYRDNTVILDAYNANPPSMKAALSAFIDTKDQPKMAILGDMFELGEDSLRYHQEIVDMAGNEALDVVVLVGKDFSRTSRPRHMYHFDTTAEAKAWWQEQEVHGYHILIKGSRGVHLEVLLQD